MTMTQSPVLTSHTIGSTRSTAAPAEPSSAPAGQVALAAPVVPVAGSEATVLVEPVAAPAAPAAPVAPAALPQVAAGAAARREASDEEKARREAKVEDLMAGLSEELVAGRANSRRAAAIARSLQRHLDGMCRHIAERLIAVGEVEETEAVEVSRTVAHFGSDIAPLAWADVARSRVDRVADRARAIGQLLDQTLPDA